MTAVNTHILTLSLSVRFSVLAVHGQAFLKKKLLMEATMPTKKNVSETRSLRVKASGNVNWSPEGKEQPIRAFLPVNAPAGARVVVDLNLVEEVDRFETKSPKSGAVLTMVKMAPKAGAIAVTWETLAEVGGVMPSSLSQASQSGSAM